MTTQPPIFYKEYKILIYPTQIHFETTDHLHIIRPDDGNYLTVFAEIPSVPRECEINRSRSLPFNLFPMIIRYAAENSLLEFGYGYGSGIEVKVDPLLEELLHPHWSTGDGNMSFYFLSCSKCYQTINGKKPHECS